MDDDTVIKPGNRQPTDGEAPTRLYPGPDATPTPLPVEPSREPIANALEVEIKNRFTLVKMLGSGGMGQVYRARDKRREEAQDKNPYVALKILHEDFKRHPQAFIALQREAQKTQSLAHPNIVTVYDFDRDGELVYLTMEELKGRTLQALAGEPLSRSQKVDIIVRIARGLAYAHDNNIVHSDLKPSNVFLTDDGQVKIVDFGIARASTLGSRNTPAASASGDDPTLFDAGDLGALTPSYASLEMLRGEQPHPADDIYALGLVAYRLLTGVHPYGKLPADQARAKRLTPRRIKGLPQQQWLAIKQALAFERADRPDSAKAFLNQFAPRHKRRLALSAAALAIGIAIAAIILQPDPNAPEIPFKDLTPAMQEKIEHELEAAQTALSFNDVNSALMHYDRVYQWHPNNRRAVAGFEKLVDRILANVNGGAANPQAAAETVNALLQYEALRNNARLLALKQTLPNAPQ